ncbi:MAG: 4-hydroxy-tetrahydrodipicolinate reductase [Spirochaetes bacterium]|nr:4-hydroxy-tetrahydrodipicolinate reductase [Spirochaetota bacterium]
MIKGGICGLGGRMGQAILRLLLEKGHSLGAAFEDESHPYLGKDAGSVISGKDLSVSINTINKDDLSNVDGVIDFSNTKAGLQLLDLMVEVKKPLVTGTTGFTDEEIKKFTEASKVIPLILSPNMSLGVNLLFKMTEIASKVLAGDFDVELFEAHHRQKLDAPSGTAKKLLDIIKENGPGLKDAPLVYDRSIKKEKRTDKEIGVQVLRGGDIVGEHTVFFTGTGERIELTHKASNRDIFARGAVLALEFLVNKEPGFYNMFDVLGI